MNIPIINIRESFEKNAGIIGSIFKHPKISLAVIGTGVAGLGALALADKVHDAYNISSEMRKRKVMKDQSQILLGLLESQKRLEVKPAAIKQKLVTEPLY